jgi:hypothetical protein
VSADLGEIGDRQTQFVAPNEIVDHDEVEGIAA